MPYYFIGALAYATLCVYSYAKMITTDDVMKSILSGSVRANQIIFSHSAKWEEIKKAEIYH